MAFVRTWTSRHRPPLVFETEKARTQRIRNDLVRAKSSIESRLAGKSVRHLAYPWGTGSALAVELSKEAGYLSNHWLRLPRRPVNKQGTDPYRFVRLKHDFLWRLPGQGRKPLVALYGFKFKRRVSGTVDYLVPEV